MNNNFNKKDYEDFIESVGEIKSPSVLDRLMKTVEKELNPSQWTILFKLLTVHLFSSLVTLSICPQFGVRVFGKGHGIMEYFMYFGNNVCFLLCGTFFLGTTVIAFKFITSRPEWNAFKRYHLIYCISLSTSSLFVFAYFSANILLGLSIFWLIGAVFGAMAIIKLASFPWKKVSFSS
jgi:hypothetical protein